MSLIPAFQFHLQDKILEGKCTIGKYDGKHPSLTCVTTGRKIFIHNPHAAETGEETISYLNVNKDVTSIVAGRFDSSLERDVLLIGTSNHLQCYDVYENRDLFYKEVPDGVGVLLMGRISSIYDQLVIVGGNCSIQGFDKDGHEQFWTVTGDNVSAMTFCDVDEDGEKELLVGSEDFDIRIFQNEDVISEVSEAERICGLCPIKGPRFGYALANGTIGVYEGITRQWRVKSKHSVTCISSYDLDGDGVPELISGWANGRVEVRREDNGQVVFRDNLGQAVSSILLYDYRGEGIDQVIVCGRDGEVRGYLPKKTAQQEQSGHDIDMASLERTLQDLSQTKQELLYELSCVEAQQKLAQVKGPLKRSFVPPNTQITHQICPNVDKGTCDLKLKVNNQVLIKGVVVFAEHLFENESLFYHPKRPEGSACIPLKAAKDVVVEMTVKVFVGTHSTALYHVLELGITLPKFAMYASVDRSQLPYQPKSNVVFSVREHPTAVQEWVCNNFVGIREEASQKEQLYFLALQRREPLIIQIVQKQANTEITIIHDNMEVAGDMLQDLCTTIGIKELNSIADFPSELQTFEKVLTNVNELNATRIKLSGEVADNSNLVKQTIMKAEDSRLLKNMPAMKRAYRQLYDVNRELIAEHDKRARNHQDLLEALKEVNYMIQKAAKLRMGSAKTEVVAQCRKAFKSNNVQSFFKAVKEGSFA